MLNKYLLIALGTAPLVAAGCGGDDTTTAGADMSFVAFKLDSGMYKNQTATAVDDACMMKLDDATLGFVGQAILPLEVNHTNGQVTFGPTDSKWTPAQPSQGSGVIDNNMGTLTAMGVFTASANCSYNVTRTNTVAVTSDNHISSQFKEVRTPITGQSDACQLPVNCTTTFTLTYAIQ